MAADARTRTGSAHDRTRAVRTIRSVSSVHQTKGVNQMTRTGDLECIANNIANDFIARLRIPPVSKGGGKLDLDFLNRDLHDTIFRALVNARQWAMEDVVLLLHKGRSDP
jgi:hypothetical protein